MDVINSNGDANFKAAPVLAPRKNVPPTSPSTADSFDDFTSATSNPESRREDHQTNSHTEPMGSQFSTQDPSQIREENPYAVINKTRTAKNRNSTSETSSTTSKETESGGHNENGMDYPPIPYQNPPTYVVIPVSNLQNQYQVRVP